MAMMAHDAASHEWKEVDELSKEIMFYDNAILYYANFGEKSAFNALRMKKLRAKKAALIEKLREAIQDFMDMLSFVSDILLEP